MAYEFKLPDLGEGLMEAQVTEWLVQEGDTVEEDQPLLTVETDKADVEIPSPASGRVTRIAVAQGKVARVGDLLVVISEEGAEAPAEAERRQEERAEREEEGEAEGREEALAAEKPGPPEEPARRERRVLATPAARRLARDLGLEIEEVQGSGADGRVTKEDIRAHAEGRRPEAEPEPEPQRPHPGETVPFTGIRRRIAENMARSAREMAQVTHFDEADVTRLMELFAELRPAAQAEGFRLTPTALFMAAAGQALVEHPMLNSQLDEEAGVIRLQADVHMAFAVATERGLLAPVVRQVNRKGLFQLAREIEELGRKAREGKASREELVGGTFTLTNVGSIGGVASTPLINPPQAAILGVHRVQERAVVRDGQMVIRKMVWLAVSYDHRILDGAHAAAFTNTLVRYLESPALLLARR